MLGSCRYLLQDEDFARLNDWKIGLHDEPKTVISADICGFLAKHVVFFKVTEYRLQVAHMDRLSRLPFCQLLRCIGASTWMSAAQVALGHRRRAISKNSSAKAPRERQRDGNEMRDEKHKINKAS